METLSRRSLRGGVPPHLSPVGVDAFDIFGGSDGCEMVDVGLRVRGCFFPKWRAGCISTVVWATTSSAPVWAVVALRRSRSISSRSAVGLSRACDHCRRGRRARRPQAERRDR
jgi:hypothetical protein